MVMTIVRVLVAGVIWTYLALGLIRSLLERRVAHRSYLWRWNQKFRWATRRGHPVAYWFSIVGQTLLLVLVSLGVYRIFGAPATGR
jgi:hypothetical protein